MGFWDIAGKVASTAGKVAVFVAKEVGTAVVDKVNEAKGLESDYQKKSDAELRDRRQFGTAAERMAAAREATVRRQNKEGS